MKDIFPKPTQPPKLVKSYGPALGFIACILLALMAVLHIFRIETLVPIIDKVLPNDSNSAGAFVVIIVLAEIFAIPFLLRLKLSPAAHVVSGFLATLAPLMWTLLSVWALGLQSSTGQFGEFLPVNGTWWLIVINLVWLSYNFFALWALGYNNLKLRGILKRGTSTKHSKS